MTESALLDAWRQIERLVGREHCSPASVVDAVAYLVERTRTPDLTPDSRETLDPALERAARAAMIPSIEWALFGTTDGDLCGDDDHLPVGELRRLLREEWAAFPAPTGSPEQPQRPPPLDFPPFNMAITRSVGSLCRWEDHYWRWNGHGWDYGGVATPIRHEPDAQPPADPPPRSDGCICHPTYEDSVPPLPECPVHGDDEDDGPAPGFDGADVPIVRTRPWGTGPAVSVGRAVRPPPEPPVSDPAAHTLSDATTEFQRLHPDGRIKMRRRSFGEAVRYLLGLHPETEDGDVLAELAVRKHEALAQPSDEVQAPTRPDGDAAVELLRELVAAIDDEHADDMSPLWDRARALLDGEATP